MRDAINNDDGEERRNSESRAVAARTQAERHERSLCGQGIMGTGGVKACVLFSLEAVGGRVAAACVAATRDKERERKNHPAGRTGCVTQNGCPRCVRVRAEFSPRLGSRDRRGICFPAANKDRSGNMCVHDQKIKYLPFD